MFAIVKRYYDKGIYTADDVAVFVRAGRLTPEQYEEIIGEEFTQ
ncbi:MAG: XkdX family protein [Acholeplasmataceae bacterium]|nr:XkdX family protein [Acholeplasmataceae bacterium]